MRGEAGDTPGAADRTPDSTDGISLDQLRQAVARGILSAEQLDALLAARPTAPDRQTAAEARRGLNAVTIAYYLGAAAVVFAFWWFLVDRWQALGAAGVLAIALAYAAIFAFTARFLGRQGFRTASALAALLTVSMAPVVAWSLLQLAGLWYEPGALAGPTYGMRVDVLETLRWIPVELATALAALVALRRVRFAVLAIPVAAVVPLVAGHLVPLVLDPDIANEMTAWMLLVSGAALIACGYATDRRQQGDEDYAGWVYLTGLVALAIGVLSAWSYAGAIRHAVPVAALALLALSLYLRRPMFLVFGTLGIVGYLAYLAFDVFRNALSFPVVLATFGVCVILLTVWLQRRYPSLARQVEAAQAGRRAVPHAALVFGGAVAVMTALLFSRLPDAHARAADQWVRVRRTALEVHRRQLHARRDSNQLRAVPPRPLIRP
ncbi:MAG TPA: hypothetical protein VNE60_05615 [Gemmatimonadaceae bacterium]|nr:hypothetical protein [Gemmatimonadaceae bacterium]